MSKYPLFKLNALASEWSKGQPFKKTDIAEHGQTPCIHYGELFTKYGVVINQCLSKTDVQGKRLSVSGDILFPASDVTPSGLARCSALMQDNVILGGDIIIMRPRHGNDPRYLSYAINYQKEQILQRVTGALIKHLSGNSLKSVIIPVPPLVDQVNLVSKLEKISALITFRKLQLEKLDQLASSRFIEMFGDPVTNSMNWKIHQLSDYIEFLTSGSRGWSQYFSSSGNYFIAIKNVRNGALSLENVQFVVPPDNAEAKRTKVEEGDLLISITADLGRTAVVSKEIAQYGGYINQHLSCVRLNRQVLEPVYVAIFLESDAGRRQFSAKNQSAVKAGLNFDSIRSLLIPVPPLSRQRAFVSFIEQLDKSKVICNKIHKGVDFLQFGV